MTENKDRFIKIRYRDGNGKTQEIIKRLEGEWYFQEQSERENLETVASIIMVDDCCFWLNQTTLIPSNHIQSFHIYDPNTNSPIQNNKRRRIIRRTSQLKEVKGNELLRLRHKDER